ncbi:leukotriene A4 hydrolase, isoform CRA_b [Rattus norvegicus]|uniref:Leukotriene A-4 hydrolase n=1 Tax=Rattus norvegicus TaxID=10116 RepID=A6IFY5_RAT|nr:leukotriene A4 hydrolase, isoform CRA_b [Rattus norvegicus]
MPEVADTCSLASPASVCRTQHLHLRCSVDFARRALTGTAALTVQSQEDNLRSLTLDTKDLTIEKVVINGQEVKYTLGESQGYKGSPMEISLPIALSKNQEVVIEISFETSPKSSALQWLTPEQTSGKQHPYLFSQCQAIHCRAILPCQDTPSVKLTYTAEVIAHEISHSWTGNLVTNKTWDHFWLNEGHTVYLERHICGRLFGEKFRHFHALGGWGELQNTIKTFGESHPFTKLVVDLKDVDPDVAYSSIPYEKGFALLFYLEQLLGGPEVFLGFLKAYVEKFSYQSVTTDDWKSFLYAHFKDKVDLLNQVDWNAWLYAPGLPPVKPNYDVTLTNACIALSQRWVTAKEEDLNSFSIEDLKDLSSHQLNEFLAQVLQKMVTALHSIEVGRSNSFGPKDGN